MHLIRLLLPLHDNNKQEFPTAYFLKVREELTDRFGGVTAFVRSPAVGLWKDVNKVRRDDMVMFEVMSNQLDKEWSLPVWFAYGMSYPYQEMDQSEAWTRMKPATS